MKKIIITAVVLLLLLITISVVFFYLTNKPGPASPAKTVTRSTPIPSPTPIAPEEEKQRQENYAKSRQEFINAKPWLLKLPLKADNYFVSYNPSSDALIAELYYTTSQNKNQQLLQAKQDALNAIKSVGVDINKQKIEYIELLKKQS